MQQKRSMEGTQRSVGTGLVTGLGISIVTGFVLAGGLALLIVKEQISIEKMHYFSLIILFIAVVAGAYTAAKFTMKTPALICGIIAVAHFVLLIAINVLLIEEGPVGVWGNLVSIALGWLCACALCISKPRKTNYKKLRNR